MAETPDVVLTQLAAAFPILGGLRLTYGAHPNEARYLANERAIEVDANYVYAEQSRFLIHEAGHALQDLARRARNDPVRVSRVTPYGDLFADPVLTGFWSVRGYPGTWEDARVRYEEIRRAQPDDYQAAYQYKPDEAFAEAFAAVWLGYPLEQQNSNELHVTTYGVPLDSAALLAFFQHAHERPLADRIRSFWDRVNATPNGSVTPEDFVEWRDNFRDWMVSYLGAPTMTHAGFADWAARYQAWLDGFRV